MALDAATIPDWTLKGELILNCNCTVFCPCVVSLGKHPRPRATVRHGSASASTREALATPIWRG